jgi:hypothetical protein
MSREIAAGAASNGEENVRLVIVGRTAVGTFIIVRIKLKVVKVRIDTIDTKSVMAWNASPLVHIIGIASATVGKVKTLVVHRANATVQVEFVTTIGSSKLPADKVTSDNEFSNKSGSFKVATTRPSVEGANQGVAARKVEAVQVNVPAPRTRTHTHATVNVVVDEARRATRAVGVGSLAAFQLGVGSWGKSRRSRGGWGRSRRGRSRSRRRGRRRSRRRSHTHSNLRVRHASKVSNTVLVKELAKDTVEGGEGSK